MKLRYIAFMLVLFACYTNVHGNNKALKSSSYFKIAPPVLIIKNKAGKPIKRATVKNKTQNYNLIADTLGAIHFGNYTLNPTDQLSITCIGYIAKNVVGADILNAGQIILDRSQMPLSEVTVKDGPERLDFKNAQNLPFPLRFHAAVSDGNYAYTISGSSGARICTQALKYDPKSNQWSLFANNLVPTIQAAAAYIPSAGKIFVIGGFSSIVNYNFFEKVETIDVKTGKVEVLPVKNPMPVAYAGSAVLGSKIYLFGGGTDINILTSSTTVNSFYEFDTTTSTFTKLPDMPEKLQTTGAIVDSVLYVFGGYEDMGKTQSKNLYAYNIKNKTWKK